MWVQLTSGQPLELDFITSHLRIEDVAASLAKINRFAGATRVPYSVAQHSVHVSKLVKRMGGSWKDSLAGLMHDAEEIAVGDIPTPSKAFIGVDSGRIGLIQACIEESLFGHVLGSDEIVRHADLVALATEKRDLLSKCERPWALELPAPDRARIKPLGWRGAQRLFLERYYMLKGKV